MGNSYRIKTELGVNKTINVDLEQDFEFLEILSLKIQQSEVYNRSCAEYGVVVGRVTANNGFGVPNARVSVFLPILPEDESNPIISSIYPYKSPSDKNEDGYRYNLLPYEKSYSTHAATGTLPSRLDALTGSTAVEIYDKYYKLTSVTNESGDYMLFGVPLGYQTIFMDLDLSDMGDFSLNPQDLIRMGIATEAQVGGDRFKSSNDLNSLPQIVSIEKSMTVSPLWGDPTICLLAINRVDFDLRDDANIDIQPTAVFMGSIFSSPDDDRIRPVRTFLNIETARGSKPRESLGNLCKLNTSVGQIVAIRQSFFQDSDGNPVLERYQLEEAGNVIDENGVWVIEVPMNLDYFVTNEFGERVISNDPEVGIPTKGKYRFKVKWGQPATLSAQTRRPYYLVPNVKEYGWTNPLLDPNTLNNTNPLLKSSYYFGLDWSGYTQGFPQNKVIDRLSEIINCEDTFYEFRYNKVYTVSGLIDQFKNGGRGRFIGIKEVDDNTCASTINKFPVNEGYRNFDLFYFIVSLLLQIIQIVMYYVLFVAHLTLFIPFIILKALCAICGFLGICGSLPCSKYTFSIKLPMLTYPDCEACDCGTVELKKEDIEGTTNGVLSYVSDPDQYITNLQEYFKTKNPSDIYYWAEITAKALGGNDNMAIPSFWKVPKSEIVTFPGERSQIARHFAYSGDLPLGERINVFNLRKSYFDGLNKIKVTFSEPTNIGKFHYDNTITVLSNTNYNSGDLLTFVDVTTSEDPNFLYTGTTSNGVFRGITGTTQTGPFQYNVTYAVNQLSNSPTIVYDLPTGTTVDRSIYPMDREYYQVITAVTVGNAVKFWNTVTKQSIPNAIRNPSKIIIAQDENNSAGFEFREQVIVTPLEQFNNMKDQYILILQRGVDPYSPKYVNKYSVGKIFGLNEDDIILTANTRVNVPISALKNNNQPRISIQSFNQTEMCNQSQFFQHGEGFTAFTSSSVGYYGALYPYINQNFQYSPYLEKFTYDVSSQTPFGVTGLRTITDNVFYSNDTFNGVNKYDLSEDLTSGSFMYGDKNTDAFDSNLNDDFDQENDVKLRWISLVSLPALQQDPMKFNNRLFSIIRTDRLPSSDQLDGLGWDKDTGLLQQNNNFAIYVIEGGGEGGSNIITAPGFTTGAQQIIPEIEGLPATISVIESFGCPNMVSLNCYEGFGSEFGVNENCADKDNVVNGCYILLRTPLLDLINGKDIKTVTEWGYRYRFFYGICRGVISQTFTNNWINGSLYMFPIQVNTFFSFRNNNPRSVYPQGVVYFDKDSNNFYVRSSPYNLSTEQFIGYKMPDSNSPVNERNLLFPTTIVDLGMKYPFYAETSFEPSAKGYIMNQLPSTSYGDTSDLVNLFVISRIADSGFIKQLVNYANSSIRILFNRYGPFEFGRERLDGDLAQNFSINSEIGVVKFSPEYYDSANCDTEFCSGNSCKYTISNNTDDIQNFSYYDTDGVQQLGVIGIGGAPQSICANRGYGDIIGNVTVKLEGCCDGAQFPTTILGTQNNPVMAIWYSSSEQDLQTKDYMTPGKINFVTINGQNFPYYYGIKSQTVPFYQWKLGTQTPIFGSEKNNWATDAVDIVAKPYQSLDRSNQSVPTYFQSKTVTSDLARRGYIYSENPDGTYSEGGAASDKFLVGAPFHFYFGIKKGASALDVFARKYLADE